MLGHASAAMTLDVYADLFDKDAEAVADAHDERLAGAVFGPFAAKLQPKAPKSGRAGGRDKSLTCKDIGRSSVPSKRLTPSLPAWSPSRASQPVALSS